MVDKKILEFEKKTTEEKKKLQKAIQSARLSPFKGSLKQKIERFLTKEKAFEPRYKHLSGQHNQKLHGNRSNNINSSIKIVESQLKKFGLEKYIGSVNIYNDPKDGNVMTHTGQLNINTAHIGEISKTLLFSENAERMKNGKTPGFASISISDVILHEVGHSFMRSLPVNFRQNELPDWFGKNQNNIEALPSFFGQENWQEAYAEAFVRVVTGRKFNSYLYDKINEQVQGIG